MVRFVLPVEELATITRLADVTSDRPSPTSQRKSHRAQARPRQSKVPSSAVCVSPGRSESAG